MLIPSDTVRLGETEAEGQGRGRKQKSLYCMAQVQQEMLCVSVACDEPDLVVSQSVSGDRRTTKITDLDQSRLMAKAYLTTNCYS